MLDLAHLIMAMSVHERAAKEHERRYVKAVLDEAINRCGFRIECHEAFPRELGKMETSIVNADGDPINAAQAAKLTETLESVRKEHDARRAEEKRLADEHEKKRRDAEAAAYKAEQDTIAAPYREARRLRNLKKLQQGATRKS